MTSGFAMSTISSFKRLENKDNTCKGKKMKLLPKEQHESFEHVKTCYIFIEKLEDKYAKNIEYYKFRDHCHYTGKYRGAADRIFNSKYTAPKEILVVFRMDLTLIIIKELSLELAEEFGGQFTSFGENTEKSITFAVPIEKEITRIDKKEKK